MFIDLLGFGIIIPLMPLWVKEQLFESEFVYGILVSSYSFMQFVFAPWWGKMSDNIGRRPVIMIGLTGTIIGFFLLTISFSLIPTIEMIFLARIVGGIFTSATLPTSQAYIADSTTGKNRAQGFGILGAVFGLGFTFGPAIGGILAIFGYWVPALFATFLAIMNLIWARKSLPETLPLDIRIARKNLLSSNIKSRNRLSTLKLIKNNKKILLIVAMFSLLTLAFSGMETTLILLGNERFGMNEVLGGFVLLIVGIVAIITQGGLIKPLSNKYPDTLLGIVGIIFIIIGFLGLSGVKTLFDMIIWTIPMAFGSSIGNPILNSLLSKEAPAEYSGEILGFNQGMSSLMRVFGPLLATGLFVIDSRYPYFIGAIILLISLCLGLLLANFIKDWKKEASPLAN